MNVIRMQTNMVLPENFVWNFPSGRNDYLFVLFKSPAVVILKNKEYAVDKGDAVLFDKFEPQRYYPTKGEFVHDFLHFDFESESEKIEFAGIPFSSVIRVNHYEEITNILYLILRYWLSASSVDKYITSKLGYVFLLMLKNNVPNVKGTIYENMLRLRTEIYNSPQFPWTVEHMAKKASLCTSYFQTIYKRLFGISCMNDVIRARIELSKILLTSSDLSVAQVAQASGYNNTEHYIRQFKANAQITPYAYRKKSSQSAWAERQNLLL